MTPSIKAFGQSLRTGARAAFLGPQILAFVPAITLGGYWFGGESVLLVMALAIPAMMGLAGLFSHKAEPPPAPPAFSIRLAEVGTLVDALDEGFKAEPRTGLRVAALHIGVDNFTKLKQDYGSAIALQAVDIICERLMSSLRKADLVCMREDGEIAVALAPMRDLDLEAMILTCGRLQHILSQPMALGVARVSVITSLGFCLPTRMEERTGQACLDAAEAALREAQHAGSGSIRAFSPNTTPHLVTRNTLVNDVAGALDAGHIVPWFQPQLNADTGQVSGMEALARWIHPEQGVILPNAFLPAVSAAGLNRRLGDVIRNKALHALKKWDATDILIPTVSINFTQSELADITLIDRIQWELDQFDLMPDRLVIEILETVMSDSQSNAVTRTIAALSALGCSIDLDDFGTGNASIAHIRQFGVNRIKIDRSFVSAIDRDPSQQSVLAAILEMADRLDVRTVAEGVETRGEHTLLSQLGCGYVQGFLIARPMPFEETLTWARSHVKQLAGVPPISKNLG